MFLFYRKKSLKPMVEASRSSPRLLAKQKLDGSATSPAFDVDVSSHVTDPAVGADVVIGDARPSEAHSVTANPIVAAPSRSSPRLLAKQKLDGSAKQKLDARPSR